MKNYFFIKNVFVLILGLFFLESFSQQNDINSQQIEYYFQLNNESSILDEYKALNDLNSQSKNSYYLLNQIGNSNQAYLSSDGNNVHKIMQIGNKNIYQFISFYNNTPSLLNALQEGNSNSLLIYGKNSIIEKINIVQKTNFKTIVIKNY